MNSNDSNEIKLPQDEQEDNRFAPLQPKLAAYETMMHKGKLVQESGGWHDQKAFNEWDRLVTTMHRDLCASLAQIIGERLMNAVLCIEANGWSTLTPSVTRDKIHE